MKLWLSPRKESDFDLGSIYTTARRKLAKFFADKLEPEVRMNREVSQAFKTKSIETRALLLHPLALMVMADMIHWGWVRGIVVRVTETVTTPMEDKLIKRVSDSHSTGRAFDISTRGWTEDDIKAFRDYYDKKYAALAAIGAGGKPALIVRHDTGHGDHFHVQLNRKYAINYVNQGVTK